MVIGATGGCSTRQTGQIEVFGAKDGRLTAYGQFDEPPATRNAVPSWGDPIRSNDDVITVQIESAYIQSLPARLTGSTDLIVFADVWEDAAAGYNSGASLTNIVYIGTNEKIPGRLNFRDALAYGPTNYKGHPLRIRLTVMILQKERSQQASSAIDIIAAIANAAAPEASAITTPVAKVLQGILKAQPDIKCFEFELTQLSDKPEGLAAIVPVGTAESGGTKTTKPVVTPATPRRPDKPDRPHWLRYEQYVLLETESHDGKYSAVGDLPLTSVRVSDSWLWDTKGTDDTNDDIPLAANYLIVRITPNQIAQPADVLRAASDANVKLMKSVTRSTEDAAGAVKDIIDAAGDLQVEVLRNKAQAMARKIVQDAQDAKQDPKEALNQKFKNQWDALAAKLAPGKGKDQAADLETSVLNHWLGKFPDGTTVTPPPAQPDADKIRTDLTGATMNTFTVGDVPFKITSVSEVKKDGDTWRLTASLTSTGDGSKKAPKADVLTRLVDLANQAFQNESATTATPFGKAVISNEATLTTVLSP
jgi:hypothetical protein